MTVVAPACRLYLVTPPTLDPKKFRDVLAQALAAGDVACVRLALADASDDAIRAAVEMLTPIAHACEVAFLLDGRAELAARLGCDGVQVHADDYAAARGALGPSRIVGVACGISQIGRAHV